MTTRSAASDPLEMIAAADEAWLGTCALVTGAPMGAPSGCGEWSNRELINHVIGGAHRYTLLLRGATAADTAATRDVDFVGDDPLARFREYSAILQSAAESADLDELVDHRAGRRSGWELLAMRVMEVALHTRDLRIDGERLRAIPDGIAAYLLVHAVGPIDDLRAQGMFGPVLVPASDSASDRLLAYAGRS